MSTRQGPQRSTKQKKKHQNSEVNELFDSVQRLENQLTKLSIPVIYPEEKVLFRPLHLFLTLSASTEDSNAWPHERKYKK